MKVSNSRPTVGTVLKDVGKALADMTLIIPLFRLIKNLFSETSLHADYSLFLHTFKDEISPLAKERLKKMELKIQRFAKEAGIAHPEQFRVLTCPYNRSPASGGRYTVLIPAEQLFKRKHLPDELQQQLNQEKSLHPENGPKEEPNPYLDWMKKQMPEPGNNNLSVKKELIEYFKNPQKESFKASVGHELGHCVLRHRVKKSWARFGWQLLSLPTLGISTLFEKRLMERLSRKQEREADIFSAKKFNGAKAMIDDFNRVLMQNRLMHPKMANKFDAKGNNLQDRDHPPFTDRIAYLKPYLT